MDRAMRDPSNTFLLTPLSVYLSLILCGCSSALGDCE